MNVQESQPTGTPLDLVDYLSGQREEVVAAFCETERLLRSPAMLSHYREFRNAITLSMRQRFKEVITEIAERGLIASGGTINEQVDSADLLEILEDEELSNSLQFAVRCSKEAGNSHWNDSRLERLLQNAVYSPTTGDGDTDAKWEEESPDAVAIRIGDKARAERDPASDGGGTKATSTKVVYWTVAAAVLLVCGIGGTGYGVSEWHRLGDAIERSNLRVSQLNDDTSMLESLNSRFVAELSEQSNLLRTAMAERDSFKAGVLAERERRLEAVRLAQEEHWRRLSNPVVTPVPDVKPPSNDGAELTHDVFVSLDQDIGPDTFTKVEVCWDYTAQRKGVRDLNEWKTLYYWRSTPLTPGVHHRYEHDSDQPPRRVTTMFKYWPVADPAVRQNLGMDEDDLCIKRSFTVESQADGIVWNKAIIPDGTQVALSPVKVSANGELRLSVIARREGAESVKATDRTTLHVVLRAKDGSGPWEPGPHSRYVVVGERITVAELGSDQVTRNIAVDLHSRFGSPELPTDVLPSEVEVVVVAFPFDLGRTIVTKKELSDAIVLSSTTVTWRQSRQVN